MKIKELYKILSRQDNNILITLLEENHSYFYECINNIRKIDIDYIIYLIKLNKMIISILKERIR